MVLTGNERELGLLVGCYVVLAGKKVCLCGVGKVFCGISRVKKGVYVVLRCCKVLAG